jgi:hypothetical protein
MRKIVLVGYSPDKHQLLHLVESSGYSKNALRHTPATVNSQGSLYEAAETGSCWLAVHLPCWNAENEAAPLIWRQPPDPKSSYTLFWHRTTLPQLNKMME